MRGNVGIRNTAGSARGAGILQAMVSDSPWGRTLYVQSTHARAGDVARTGRDINNPLATVKQAIANCRDGDVILVGEGHVETINDATSWDLANNSVQIIGLGVGTRRPTFTINTTTGARFTVSGDGNTLSNLRFNCGIDAATLLLTVTGNGNLIADCEVYNTAAMQPSLHVLVSGDDNVVDGLRTGAATTTAGTVACVRLGSTTGHRSVVRNCVLDGDFSSGCIDTNLVASLGILIENNALRNENAVDACINIGNQATTGVIRNNHMEIATDAQTTYVTLGAAALVTLFENYGANQPAERGIAVGTASV